MNSTERMNWFLAEGENRMDYAILALGSVIDLVTSIANEGEGVALGDVTASSFAVLLDILQKELRGAQASFTAAREIRAAGLQRPCDGDDHRPFREAA